jgi:hypothetical protein
MYITGYITSTLDSPENVEGHCAAFALWQFELRMNRRQPQLAVRMKLRALSKNARTVGHCANALATLAQETQGNLSPCVPFRKKDVSQFEIKPLKRCVGPLTSPNG